MSGKGSVRRPTQVDLETMDENWSRIFHRKQTMITEEISKYFAPNGKREASVLKTEKGYIVELYEKNRYIRTVDVTTHSLSFAEDVAENWTLGILNE